MSNIKKAIYEIIDSNEMVQYFEGKNKKDVIKKFKKSFPGSRIININLYQVTKYKSLF